MDFIKDHEDWEVIAVGYLLKKGFDPEPDYSSRHKADLVFQDEDETVMAWCRVTEGDIGGMPELELDEGNMRNMRRAALHKLSLMPEGTAIRCDVISANVKGDEVRLRHLVGAYSVRG